MNPSVPDQAQVVIVGGGVIGAGVAWHLAGLGCTDVLVLERGQLGCGTTWHSAGNIIRMSSDPTTTGIFSYGMETMAQLHRNHGIGWRRCGRMMVARSPQRAAEFQEIHDNLVRCDVAIEIVTPEEVVEKIPIMAVSDVRTALWSPGDGRVNPTDLVHAYIREARAKGVRVCEGVDVRRAVTRDGRVTGVETDRGIVHCDVMVNCAGMWARELGLRNGVAIPLYAVQHFYALTEAIEGVYPEMPTFRDPDGLIYGREEVGGLLVGCFDRNAIPVAIGELPQPFEFALLEENWDQFMPYMEQAMHRIPALRGAGIRTLLNGPESFTPDAEAHLDRAPGLENYFVLAGLSSAGVTRSAGMGRALAHWIVDGDPGMDTRAYSLSRFPSGVNGEDYLRRRIPHVPSGHFDPGP